VDINKFNYGKYSGNNENTIAIMLNDLTIYFSYNTIVAFDFNGELFVVKNEWDPTTGKHLNWIDGGDKSSRLSSTDFNKLLNITLNKKI